MKLLAILRDSVREAIDTKVFAFTVVVSLLVVLVTASVAFRPVPAEEQFRGAIDLMTRLIEFASHGKGPRFDIEDFEQTNPDAPLWQRDYRFLYVVEAPEPEPGAKVETPKADPQQLREQLRLRFEWIDRLRVTAVPSANPRQARFQVQTHGTRVADRRGWVHEPSLLFGALPLALPLFERPLARQLEFITDDLIGTFGAAITMLLGSIITAFFIPNMLRKGAIDLLLAKPIHRSTLLVYKYIGGLSFMFLNTVVIIGGIWLVLGLRTGVWMPGLLWCVLIFTFQFAIFYALSTYMAVLTQSPIVAILSTVLAWVFLYAIGFSFQFMDALRPERINEQPSEVREVMPKFPRWTFVLADVIHVATPHYKDLDLLTTRLIRNDLADPSSSQRQAIEKAVGSINWPESIAVTVAYIVLLVGASCWRFAVKDY
jgi:ABC-type transport system involved in multi-copper enzyme maturation permease subunit